MLVLALLALDLTGASVSAPADFTGPEKKAVAMLVDEVEKRSQVRWPLAAEGAVRVRRGSGPAEGYRIQAGGGGVTVTGNDARGVLFGIGRLLRELHMSRGAVSLDERLSIASAPHYPVRGHQLGYRPKTNSYDGWTVALWEQYIRDLAVFGTNAIELIPPRSDDDPDSPHFPLPPMRMMTEMSRLCDEYGLDVWIWYPAMDRDYADPQTVQAALAAWGEVFKRLPRVDAVFVPGGDPGHTRPRVLMALLEKQAANLRRYHPKAQMWVSPQSFNREWTGEFLDIMKTEPAWLAGVVFGPQVRISLPELRAALPKRYPIRNYPDITHTRQCQYPVPDWDVAYAATEAREPVGPRPAGQARIFRLLQPLTIGFLTYSEGCNDDVNKIVWSALGWDPEADVTGVLREYARYFIGERYRDTFAQGLLALERNWQGKLSANGGVETTLAQFRQMERQAEPAVLLNWRFQQGLYRAYYDAYTRARLAAESAAEDRAMDRLREAGSLGALEAMAAAERELDGAAPAAPGLRSRIFELAEALFQSIRMQLSVARYKAISVGRGANLDTLDVPLNNRLWLKARFAAIRARTGEGERLQALHEIVDWTNPGPGGFYDDLGDVARQPHLLRGPGFHDDPPFLRSSLVTFDYRPEYRTSWWHAAETLHETPLEMLYTGLDPTARYKVRVVYGTERAVKVRLAANGVEVHPWMEKPAPPRPLEFPIPVRGTELKLAWTSEPGRGGNGRGCQVAEVWLMRE